MRILLACSFCCLALNSVPVDAQVFLDDFNDGDANWVDGIGLPTGTVMDGNYVFTGNSDYVAFLAFENNRLELTDASITTSVRITEANGSSAFVGIFARGVDDVGVYYGVLGRGGGLFLLEYDEFGDFVIHDSLENTGLSPETEDVFMKLDVFGESIAFTAWADEMEPPARLSLTDDTLTIGNIGMGMSVNGQSTAEFRFFQFDLEPNICDFSGDGLCDRADINMLMNQAATSGMETDLTGDGIVNNADRDAWLALAGAENGFAGPFLVGDSNLDGIVNSTDLNTLGISWRNSDEFDWTAGNFTADGSAGVNAADLNALGINWQQSLTNAAAVPEPSTFVVFLASLLWTIIGRRQLPFELSHVSPQDNSILG